MRKKAVFLTILLLLSLLAHKQSLANELKIGLINTDRPPYFWQDKDGNFHGIYVKLLNQVSKDIKIPVTYERYPQARLRLLMKRGALDIEPGIDKNWRQEPEELANSVYSKPFMISGEIWVSGAKADANEIGRDGRSDLIYCGVNGFNHPKIKYKDIAYVQSEKQILEMLNNGRCGYSIIPYPVYTHFNKDKQYKLTTSPFIRSYTLRIRLNKKHEHLLPYINRTIAQMIKDNRLE